MIVIVVTRLLTLAALSDNGVHCWETTTGYLHIINTVYYDGTIIRPLAHTLYEIHRVEYENRTPYKLVLKNNLIHIDWSAVCRMNIVP